jgi:hypothetical protein
MKFKIGDKVIIKSKHGLKRNLKHSVIYQRIKRLNQPYAYISDINTAAKNINDSTPRLLNEERYTNTIHPEESMEAREASWSFFPELRMSSFPYLISASVFMASLSIILIFNMYGFSGQVNIPVSITQILSLFNSPASSVPFYLADSSSWRQGLSLAF